LEEIQELEDAIADAQEDDSDEDDILHSFYIPALARSISYKRLSGSFSSSSLALAARGLAGLIFNKGKQI
jgi:hypothetical protein